MKKNKIHSTTTLQEMLQLNKTLCAKALELMSKKSHDYATDNDPLRNFREFGGIGVVIRLWDKLARLRSFEENGILKVENETILDTVEDIINYTIIYYALHLEKTRTQP